MTEQSKRGVIKPKLIAGSRAWRNPLWVAWMPDKATFLVEWQSGANWRIFAGEMIYRYLDCCFIVLRWISIWKTLIYLRLHSLSPGLCVIYLLACSHMCAHGTFNNKRDLLLLSFGTWIKCFNKISFLLPPKIKMLQDCGRGIKEKQA